MNDTTGQPNTAQVFQSPDTFIQQAIEKGSDVTVLSGLFELKQRWEQAAAKRAFHAAMLKFQTIKPVLPKTSEVSFGGGKTAYKFCPIEKMEELLKAPLAECGLTYRWESIHDGERDGQKCIITHIEGHSEANAMFAPSDDSGNKNKIQGIGSSSKYLQRYTLVGALGLTTSDQDDDGVASGDIPYLKLLEHNDAVRDNLQAILAVKEALSDGDYENASMYMYEMGKDTVTALWLATTKGGIFTTKEREQLKSDECAAARTAYTQAKGEQV